MKKTLSHHFLQSDMPLFLVMLFLVEFLRGAALISFLPIYGDKELGLDLDAIGAAITASFLTDTAMKLVLGYLLDRFSIRTIVCVAHLLSMAGIFVMQYADVPWMFIAAGAVYGIGISPVWIVCLTRVKESKRGEQMGILYTIWLIGIGCGPVVLNLLLDQFEPNVAYLVMQAVAIVAFALSLLIAPGRTIHLDVVPFRKQLAILGERLRDMRALLPGMVLQTLGAGMLLPVLPSFAEHNLNMTSTQYTILLFVGGACTAIGLIPMGKLSDHFGKKWFLIVGFLAFGIVLFGLTYEPPLALALLGALVLGVSYAAVLPAWNALLAAYVPPGQQGLGWGVLSTVEGLGGMIGPVVGGLLATRFSETHVVGLAGILFAFISLFYIMFPFHAFRGEGRMPNGAL